MKRILVCISALVFAVAVSAQDNKPMSGQMPMGGQHPMGQQRQMASPPEKASVTINGKSISISYNSPRVKAAKARSSTKAD